MADLKPEAELWSLMLPYLKRWGRGQLSENDAWNLLQLYEAYQEPSMKRAPLPSALRERRVGKTQVKSEHSLAVMAFAFHKDTTTIRRWCKMGRVPGAYQTRGGHWRIPNSRQLMSRIASNVAGWTRKPKDFLKCARWKDCAKAIVTLFANRLPTLLQLDAELRSGSQAERERSVGGPCEKSLSKFIEVYEGGGESAVTYVRLRLAARRLYLAQQKLTVEALAQQVGVCRRTLFSSRYHAAVKEAIRQADNAIESDRQTEKDVEDDHGFVLGLTTETKVESQGSSSQLPSAGSGRH